MASTSTALWSVARSIGSLSMPLHHRQDDDNGAGSGQKDEGIGIVSFLAAVGVALATGAVQILLFLLLRNKLARILYVVTSSL